MLDRTLVYEIIYSLAARDGREEALFGDSEPAAREAFRRSIAGNGFPELWFEIPLAGEPWFDLHALASREHLASVKEFSAEDTGGNPRVFEWFSAQREGARQLALSWDTGSGDTSDPAVQLLVSRSDPAVTCGFLEAAGRPDAVPSYLAFRERLPHGWFACYAGVFPTRPQHNLRVECIPAKPHQQAYVRDSGLLEEHLRQVGMTAFDDDLISRCRYLADTPFFLEFQFDVEPDGSAGKTFGASLRFASPSEAGEWKSFDPNGPAGDLMHTLEDWGLADERWHRMAETAYTMRARKGSDDFTMYCFPTFIKLRWRDGSILDAKAYLQAGVANH